MSDVRCPMCHDGVLARAEGRLDQSGDSFLPTEVWHCARCEYTRYAPAVKVRWQPSHPAAEPAAEPAPARRAA